jgi:hypothetical protein
VNRTTVLATATTAATVTSAAAAIRTLFLVRQWYRDQQAERLVLTAHCRLVEEKLAGLEFAVSAQSRAVVAAASRPPRIVRPQGDTPPWFS